MPHKLFHSQTANPLRLLLIPQSKAPKIQSFLLQTLVLWLVCPLGSVSLFFFFGCFCDRFDGFCVMLLRYWWNRDVLFDLLWGILVSCWFGQKRLNLALDFGVVLPDFVSLIKRCTKIYKMGLLFSVQIWCILMYFVGVYVLLC